MSIYVRIEAKIAQNMSNAVLENMRQTLFSSVKNGDKKGCKINCFLCFEKEREIRHFKLR